LIFALDKKAKHTMADAEQGSAPPAAPSTISSVKNNDVSPLVIILVASAVEFIAAARVCDKRKDFHIDNYCSDEYGYAVAVGVGGVVISLAYILILRFSKSVHKFVTQFVAIALLAWWGAGAGVVTFRAPFVATGNGYFSAWLAFGAAGYFAFHQVPIVHWILVKLSKGANSLDHQLLWATFAASVIELATAATACDQIGDKACRDNHNLGWGIACGAISTVMTLIAIFAPLGKFKMYYAIILALLWAFGAGVLTFDDPWVFTGNGYFSSWISFFCTALWTYLCIAEVYPSLRRTTA